MIYWSFSGEDPFSSDAEGWINGRMDLFHLNPYVIHTTHFVIWQTECRRDTHASGTEWCILSNVRPGLAAWPAALTHWLWA